MSTIKKQYQEIYELLQANEKRKVSSILPQLVELMTKKGGGGSDIGKTFILDEEGKPLAVYCYYHKKWEDVTQAEYGSKANTATKLNTMCKEGTSNWTKQQRTKKKQDSELLAKVSSGELEVDMIGSEQEKIAENAKEIKPREDGHGFETHEELMASLTIEEIPTEED